ncbi:MAG TPA: hypothetical protein VGD56_08310 [Gemmatirosa sp.]
MGADLRWGLGWGVAYAFFYSAFVAVTGALNGGEAAAHYHTTVPRIVAMYWTVGPGTGALVGVLRPLTRTALGTACVGLLAGTLVYGGIGLAQDGPTQETLIVALIAGTAVGVPGALILRSRARGREAAGSDAPAP